MKVGGMITEAKKIRTRSGSTMMFATLDDLEGTVEVVVFEKALAAAEGVLGARRDRARARPRGPQGRQQGLHRRPGRRRASTRPRPRSRRPRPRSAERAALEQPRRLRLRVDAARLEATVIADLRELFERYPGNDDFVLEMQTRAGLRRLRFGGD